VAKGKISFDVWAVYVLGNLLNAKKTPLTDRQLRLFLILDGHARDKPYCWPKNSTLTEFSGKAPSKVREILRELEQTDPPCIGRIPNQAKRDRTGFVLYRRSHPSYPAWPIDRPIEEAAALILGHRGRGRASGVAAGATTPDSGRGGTPVIGQDGRPIPGGDGVPDSGLQKLTQAGNSTQSNHTHAEAAAPRSAAAAGAGAVGGRKALTPEMSRVVERARSLHGGNVAADVERNAGRIAGALGANLECYVHALGAALDRDRRNPGDPLRSVWAWCLTKAEALAKEGGPPVPAPARPAVGNAPPRLVDPLTLTAESCVEDIIDAMRWFVGRGQLTPDLVNKAATNLCRSLYLDPRGSKYDTSVPGKKFHCHLGFEWVCRWLASGQLSWERLSQAFDAAQQESRTGPRDFNGSDLGRGLLRRLVHPKPEAVGA
jgi:hypothetical protein